MSSCLIGGNLISSPPAGRPTARTQRRISSEASIGKLLFANAWKMLVSRGLINDANGRSRQAEALNQLIRRLEVIRALSIADRGASTLRDVARETL